MRATWYVKLDPSHASFSPGRTTVARGRARRQRPRDRGAAHRWEWDGMPALALPAGELALRTVHTTLVAIGFVDVLFLAPPPAWRSKRNNTKAYRPFFLFHLCSSVFFCGFFSFFFMVVSSHHSSSMYDDHKSNLH